MIHVYNRDPSKDGDRCAASVHRGRMGLGQCSHNAKHTEPDDDGNERGWCGTHRPSRVAEDERKREARWKRESEVRDARYEKSDARDLVMAAATTCDRSKLPEGLRIRLGIYDAARNRLAELEDAS